jgi:beta-lactam-binding protein with PASTA domain
MRWIQVLLALVGSVVVFALSTTLTVRFLLNDESGTNCPNVTGLDIEEAKQTVARYGLTVLVSKYETRKEIPYNRVLLQQPDAGTPVRQGRAISVILSNGPKPQPIPDVLGFVLEDAVRGLAQSSILVKKTIFVPSTDVGKVVAQIPAAGQNILDENGMTLIVGGHERRFFVMPDISERDIVIATEEMDRKNIRYTLGNIQAEGSRTPVFRPKIVPGTIFNEDTVVDLPPLPATGIAGS